MSENITIGRVMDAAIMKATAEMQAGRAVMAKESQPGDLNPFIEMRKHLAEVIDAILDAVGACGGDGSKRIVLKDVLSRHGFRIE